VAGTELLIDTGLGSVDCFTHCGGGLLIRRFLDWSRLELEVVDDFNIYIFTGPFGQIDVVPIQLVGAAYVDVVAILPNRIQLVGAIGMTDQEAYYRGTPGEPDSCVFHVSISEERCAAIAGAFVNHDNEFAIRRGDPLDYCVITVNMLHRTVTRSHEEREADEKKS
jgi:hypothetical protein